MMPMPGGWTMSMAWMRIPGQSWTEAAATFVGMWVVMMVPMMLPSLIPLLRRYRLAVSEAGGTSPGRRTVIAAVAYFFVWTMAGMAVFALGASMASIEMRHEALARVVPVTAGAAVLVAGLVQFTPWKARQLACCRDAPARRLPRSTDAVEAWRQGMRLACVCGRCCGNLMAILLVTGVMDIRMMAAVTTAISLERLAPRGERVARLVGAAVVAASLVLIGRALGDR